MRQICNEKKNKTMKGRKRIMMRERERYNECRENEGEERYVKRNKTIKE